MFGAASSPRSASVAQTPYYGRDFAIGLRFASVLYFRLTSLDIITYSPPFL